VGPRGLGPRYGGEEFCLILTVTSSAEAVSIRGTRSCARVGSERSPAGKITLSIGRIGTQDAKTVDEAAKAADAPAL